MEQKNKKMNNQTKKKTAAAKKESGRAMFGFAVNFCTIFALVCMMTVLLSIDGGKASQRSSADVSSSLRQICAKMNSANSVAPAPVEAAPMVNVIENTADVMGEGTQIQITATNEGFDLKKFEISSGTETRIYFLNNDDKQHSFVIDELMVNSGVVQPGMSSVVTLPSMATEARDYEYRSDVEGDDKDLFGGTVTIISQ